MFYHFITIHTNIFCWKSERTSHIFSTKKNWHTWDTDVWNFNVWLTKDVSFEQPGLDLDLHYFPRLFCPKCIALIVNLLVSLMGVSNAESSANPSLASVGLVSPVLVFFHWPAADANSFHLAAISVTSFVVAALGFCSASSGCMCCRKSL